MDTTIYEQILNLPSPTREEEAEMYQAYLSNEEGACDRFVYRYMRLVISMAIYLKRKGVDAPLPDLIQEGVIGLIHGLQHYNPEKNVRFSTYASYWIKHYLTSQRRNTLIHTTRKTQTWKYRVARAEGFLYMHLQHEPSRQEIADWMNVPLQVVDAAKTDQEVVSASECFDPDIGTAYEDMFTYEDESDASTEVELQQDISRLLRVKETLGDRDQQILQLRYEEDMTLQEIGNEIGLTRERVRQILDRIHSDLRRGMDVSG